VAELNGRHHRSEATRTALSPVQNTLAPDGSSVNTSGDGGAEMALISSAIKMSGKAIASS
jgi:hypothetical protein